MNYVGQLAETVFGTVKELYKGLNPATLTGCIDVIVVRHPDGSLHCSPFHVRFGKLRVLRSSEKVVDIEINGKPVDLHMKLGDNGEAFFVQQMEKEKESIPDSLCTSPITLEKPELVTRSSSLYEKPEGSSSEMALRKKRMRKKKSKKKELASESTSEEEIESEKALEEKRKLLTSNNSMYYSFTDAHTEGGGILQSKEAYPFSDGELAPLLSLSPDCSSAPKSDSELEIRNPELPLGSESHMKWSWGRLPVVSKSECVETTKPTTSIAPTAAIFPTSAIPVGETTHFVPITRGVEGNLGSLHSGTPCSLVTPKPVFSIGNYQEPSTPTHVIGSNIQSAQTLSREVQSLAATAEYEGNTCLDEVVEQVQKTDQEFSSPRKTSLGSTESFSSLEMKLEKRKDTVKRSPHLGPTDIYLEDLSNLDSEQVALYFPKSAAELSGQAQTEPGSFSRDSSVGNITDNFLEFPMCPMMPHILLSVCGGLGDDGELSQEEKFLKYIVSYDEFVENPGILEDPNLVIRIHKKYYNWAVAAPMLLSLQAFHKSLPKSTVEKLMKEKMPKKGGRWWFSWRRKLSNEEQKSTVQKTDTADKHWKDSSQREDASSSDESISSGQGDESIADLIVQKFLPTYKKSLRLSSDQIKSLNLKDGPNEVVFSVTTQYQGTCRCEATIYLWNWDDKVVISDIDGTITRSDALGHILPQLGKDWTHQGITKLFHKIHLNGYKFLYCSARTIGMAHITKGYLEWVSEQGCVLPKGPVLLAPSSLFSAFHREVIEKKPEVFKIACLTDIRNLFGDNRQPFHAAFGNRTNDAYAYKKVKLPESRIFTVNPKGELIQELIKIHKSTYDRLCEVVELFFPPLGKDVSTSLACPEFSQLSYWRSPLPSVDFEDLA